MILICQTKQGSLKNTKNVGLIYVYNNNLRQTTYILLCFARNH